MNIFTKIKNEQLKWPPMLTTLSVRPLSVCLYLRMSDMTERLSPHGAHVSLYLCSTIYRESFKKLGTNVLESPSGSSDPYHIREERRESTGRKNGKE